MTKTLYFCKKLNSNNVFIFYSFSDFVFFLKTGTVISSLISTDKFRQIECGFKNYIIAKLIYCEFIKTPKTHKLLVQYRILTTKCSK